MTISRRKYFKRSAAVAAALALWHQQKVAQADTPGHYTVMAQASAANGDTAFVVDAGSRTSALRGKQ